MTRRADSGARLGVLALAVALVAMVAAAGVTIRPPHAAAASDFPVLPVCALPASPAPPPDQPQPSQTQTVKDQSCIPEWGVDYYKAVWDTSNADFNNGKFVNAASLTANPGELSVGDSSDQMMSVTFNSLHTFVSPSFNNAPPDNFVPTRPFPEHVQWPGTFGQTVLGRMRGHNGTWDSWVSSSSPVEMPFSITSTSHCGYTPNAPFEDKQAYPPYTCPFAVKFNTVSTLNNELLTAFDWQLMVPMSWIALEDSGQSQIVGATGSTWMLINMRGTGFNNHAPHAEFHSSAVGPAGSYQFVSDSTDSDAGDVLSYSWDLDDNGQTATGSNTSYTFTKPGVHHVKLTVTDSHGDSDSITHDVTVVAPPLTVSLSLPDKNSASFDKNEQSRVRITVHTGAGVGSLSSLNFDNPALKIDAANRMHIVSGPTPAITPNLTLAPGATKTYDYNVQADDAGRVDLSTKIIGQDAAGKSVSADNDKHVDVDATFLKITVTADPSDVTVVQHDDGPVAKKVTVTVSIENTSTVGVDDINLDGNVTIQALDDPSPEPIPVAQTDANTKTRSIGHLDAGQKADDQTFTLDVTGDGKYRLGTLVTYTNPDDESTLHKTNTVDIKSGTTLAYFEAHVDGDGAIVKAGDSFVVRGTVENRSSIDKLELKPLFAEMGGNGGTASVVENGTVPKCECGLPLIETLKPLQKVEIKATVHTTKGGGTRTNIGFEPKFAIINDDNTTTDVGDDKVLVKAGSGSFHQSIDDADPPIVTGNLGTWALNFSENAVTGTFEAIIGGAEAVFIGIPSALGSEFGKAIAGQQTVTSKLAQVYLTALEYLATSYKAITTNEAQREKFYNDVSNGIDQEILKQFGMHAEDVAGTVDEFFTPFATAMVQRDYNKASALAGEALGQVVGPEVGPAVAKKMIQRVAACVLAQVGEREAVTLAEKLIAAPSGIKTLPEGLGDLAAGATLGDEAMRKLYGVGSDMLENLKAWAKQRDIIVGVRYRNAKSIELAEAGAVLKPQNMKLKTVDATDISYLGYHAGDEATVVLKEPISFQQLTDNLAAAGVDSSSAEAQTAVSRWKARVKEWNGRETYLEYAKPLDQEGGIPIGFDFQANGIGSELRPTVFKPRAMALEEVEAGYFRVKIADEGGTLRSVTGDVDIVDIRHSNGKALNIVERAQAYDDLQQIIGAQHGDTPTWVNEDGDFIWQQKANLVNDHSIGGEAVAQIAPDGKVRAVYIDPKLTFFDTAKNESYIWWQGGYRTLSSDAMTLGQLHLPRLAAGDFGAYMPPPGWHLPGTGQNGDAHNNVHAQAAPIQGDEGGLGPCTWTYSNSTSQVLRYAGGKLQTFTVEHGWTDTNLAAPCATGGAGGTLAMMPQTSLSADAAKGTKRVEVNDLKVFAPQAVGKVDWFVPGQQVVINPGGANQEVATIDHLGSLDFTAPLAHAHTAGEMVSAVPTSSTDNGGTTGTTVAPGSQVSGSASGPAASNGTSGPLPFTGASTGVLVAIGVLFLTVGALLRVVSRRRLARSQV